MPESALKCSQPTRGPIAAAAPPDAQESTTLQEEPIMIMARVGQPAPDFEAMAYQQGSFKLVKLSDYAGQWRLVCFYPGDFTFV